MKVYAEAEADPEAIADAEANAEADLFGQQHGDAFVR